MLTLPQSKHMVPKRSLFFCIEKNLIRFSPRLLIFFSFESSGCITRIMTRRDDLLCVHWMVEFSSSKTAQQGYFSGSWLRRNCPKVKGAKTLKGKMLAPKRERGRLLQVTAYLAAWRAVTVPLRNKPMAFKQLFTAEFTGWMDGWLV